MFSLIIPVFRNEENILPLLHALRQLSHDLAEPLEVVFVVDGSPDQSHAILVEHLPNQNHRSTLIHLTRNFGSFAAIRVGLEVSTGRRFAVMAADLQEPPELILEMQQCLAAQEADLVVGVRRTREDPWFSRLLANLYWSAYRRWIMPEVPAGGVDIFGGTEKFRAALLLLNEARSSLIGQVFWLGFRRKEIEYTRRARLLGKSAWTLKRKLAYLSDSIFAFSDLPIRLLLRVGSVGIALAAVLGVAAASARIAGVITVPGYAMTLIAILFFGAINIFGLGIVGTYAWRAYENSKCRPLALILDKTEFLPSEQSHDWQK